MLCEGHSEDDADGMAPHPGAVQKHRPWARIARAAAKAQPRRVIDSFSQKEGERFKMLVEHHASLGPAGNRWNHLRETAGK